VKRSSDGWMDGCIQLLDVLNNGMCCVIFGWPEKECLSVRACVHAGQLGPVSKPVIRVFEPLCRPSQTPPKKVTSSYVHVGAESVPAYFYFCFLLLLDLFTVVCVCVSLYLRLVSLYTGWKIGWGTFCSGRAPSTFSYIKMRTCCSTVCHLPPRKWIREKIPKNTKK
jgi:hypothetical protein